MRSNITRKVQTSVVVFLSLLAIPLCSWGKEYSSEELIPGTWCPKPVDQNHVSICGTLRSHDKDPTGLVDTLGFDNEKVGDPVKGTYVFLYECDGTSTTCKVDGNLVHPYSWTTTGDNGMFYLRSRKLGGNQTRYLVFACREDDGTGTEASFRVDSIHRIPSYRNLPKIVEYVSCENREQTNPDGEIVRPLPMMKFGADKNVMLACDTSTAESGGLKMVSEAASKIDPVTEATFNVYVEGFDQRFTPTKYGSDQKYSDWFRAASFVSALTSRYSPGADAPGSLWSKNCRDLAPILGWQLCPDVGDDPDTYERKLYTFGPQDAGVPYTVLINNVGLPPKNVLLSPREITARADFSAYTHDPFRTTQFLINTFGACLEKNSEGKSISLRKYGEAPEKEYMDCEALRECVDNFGRTPDDISSATMSGVAMALTPRFFWEELYEEYYGETAGDTPVICEKEGEQIKLGDIQPFWDKSCTGGEDGCQYKLSSLYFSPYLIFAAGGKAATTYNSTSFFVSNSSYKPNPTDTPKEDNLVVGQEGVGAVVGGAATVIPGVTSNTIRDSIHSTTYVGEAFTGMAGNNNNREVDKSYVNQLAGSRFLQPDTNPEIRAKLLGGDFSIVNFGNEMTNYCQLSNNNGMDYTNIDQSNEGTIDDPGFYLNKKSQDGCEEPVNPGEEERCGLNYGQYPDNPIYNQPVEKSDESGTATSHIVYSTAAINRSQNIPQVNGFEKMRIRAYDATMNTAIGTGVVNFEDTVGLLDLVEAFMNSGDESVTYKTFYDNEIDGISQGEPIARDDFVVRYDRLETPHGVIEAATEDSFERFFPFPDPSSNFRTEYEASYPYPRKFRSAWGYNYCYPWGNGEGTDDSNTPPFEEGGNKIEEQFGAYIPIREFCGEGTTVLERSPEPLGRGSEVPLKYTKTYHGISTPNNPNLAFNGQAHPNPISDYEIANTCRPIQCRIWKDGALEKCEERYKWAWCAEQQITTMKDISEAQGCKGGNAGRYCYNGYLDRRKDPIGNNTAECGFDPRYWPNDEIEVCCIHTARLWNPLKGQYDIVCQDTAELIDNWTYCTVQVAGPLGAQGKMRMCDGTAEFTPTVEVVPQNYKEPDSQNTPAEASELTNNLLFRMYRPRWNGMDQVCVDPNDPSTCRETMPSCRTGALETISASAVEKKVIKLPDSTGEEEIKLASTDDETSIEKDHAVGDGCGYNQFFSPIRPSYTSRIILEDPKVCGEGGEDYGWDCVAKPIPVPENLDLANGLHLGCSINANASGCKNLLLGVGTTSPAVFSQTFMNVLKSAGNDFKVPPSLLLARMKLSGGLDGFLHYFTSEPATGSTPATEQILIHDPNNDYIGTSPWYSWLPIEYRNGRMYNCNNLEGGQQGPFKMWKFYHDREIERLVVAIKGGPNTGTALDAVKNIQPNREFILSESRCNFLNSAYVTAAALRNEANRWANEFGEQPPMTCDASEWSSRWNIGGKALRYLQYPFVIENVFMDSSPTYADYAPGGLGQQIMDACK